MNTRKLSDEQERCALAIYLCGVSSERIQREYNISKFTLQDPILCERSRKWNDPLIELYRKTKPGQRLRNSAHLYLAFHDIDVPWKKLVEQERDKQIYRAIEDSIYLPRTKQVIENTSLDRFITTHTGIEMLIQDIFGERTSEELVKPILLDRLHKEYQESEKNDKKFSLDAVYHDAEELLVDRIKRGGLGITPSKIELVCEMLKTLSEKEQGVISSLYGINCERKMKLEDAGSQYNVCRERVRQIKKEALGKLKCPLKSKKFEILTRLATDEEVSVYLAGLREEQKTRELCEKLYLYTEQRFIQKVVGDKGLQRRILGESKKAGKLGKKLKKELDLNKSVHDLGLSVRVNNCLASSNIETVRELTEKTEQDLLRCRNFGYKSLAEIKEVLSELGLGLSKQ